MPDSGKAERVEIVKATGAIYVNSRKRDRGKGPSIIPESFWDRFGPDAAVVEIDHPGAKPRVTTWQDLGREKRERQAKSLRWRREGCGRTERRALYVWVFHCPGVDGVAYYGWWTYLVGRGISIQVRDLRDYSGEMRLREPIMRLFPVRPGLFAESLYDWMPLFARKYCVRRPDGKPRLHAGRIQGKAMIWADVTGNCFERIIGRAYLPNPSCSS